MTFYKFATFITFFLLLAIPELLPAQTADEKSIEKKSGIKSERMVLTGLASYYHNKFHGRKMANGDNYSKHRFTAACNKIPIHKWIKVTCLTNNRSVIVRITDRMHKKNKRLIDLSYVAAQKLNMVSYGLVKVKVEVLNGYKPSKRK